MNSEQLRLFISGAFGSEAEARQIMKLLRPSLARALARVREIVEELPDESLTRQRVWRQLLPEIERIMAPYNDQFIQALSNELPKDGLRAAEETVGQLKSVGVPVLAGDLAPSFVMADSTKFLLKTKVNERRLIDFFLTEDGKPSPFVKANRRMIDQIVTGGIINGEETKVIAAKLIPQLTKKMSSQAVAIARTAIQDYNRQVKEAVWADNKDSFEAAGLKYEWVAALDSRTCPTCAPLDGDVRDKETDFPKTPVHVNCRCQVILIDPDDRGRIRYGQQAYDQQPTGDGVYKTKKRVKGEDLFRKNVEVATVDGKSPRYADFLANSNRTTQAMFFGGGNPGAVRAERFRSKIAKGESPRDALKNLTNLVNPEEKANTEKGVERRFKPVTD